MSRAPKIKKINFLLLLVISALGLFGFGTEAAQAYRNTGSVIISPQYAAKAVSGCGFDIYKVADAKIEGYSLSFDITQDFSGAGVNLDEIGRGSEGARLAAQAFYSVLRTDTAPYIKGLETSDTLSDMPLGIYLIVQASAPEDYILSEPFLAVLPALKTIDASSAWEYDITLYPKLGKQPYEKPPVKETVKPGGDLPAAGMKRLPIPAFLLSCAGLLISGIFIRTKDNKTG